MALWTTSASYAGELLSLHGKTGAAVRQLYFNVARLPSAKMRRGTTSEFIVLDGASGIVRTSSECPCGWSNAVESLAQVLSELSVAAMPRSAPAFVIGSGPIRAMP